jgi:hypothetical protein
MYAGFFYVCIASWNWLEVKMVGRAKLKRKSYFVDERALNRAKKALGVKTEAEVIRLSVERVAEMEEFWGLWKKLAGLSELEAWRSLEMAAAILDTSVYIDHWERGCIKTLWKISGEPISFAIQQWSYPSFGAVLEGVRPSDWSPAFLNWPRSDGSLRWPTGGRPAGLSETSVISRTGT